MMNQVMARIRLVADELTMDGQELSPVLIMWQFCNQTMDDELKQWGTNIVDVAEKVVYYLWKLEKDKALSS